MSRTLLIRRLPALVAISIVCITSVSAQSGAKNGEWRAWAGDLASTRYAPLDQINADNFSSLEVAWTFKTEHLGKNPDYNLQATPLMINGVLYFTSGAHQDAVAMHAGTAEMLWMHQVEEGARKSPRVLSGRGVGYWTDGRGDERIFYVTIGYQLVGLNAKTGQPLSDFGKNGIVDLRENDDQVMDLMTADVGWNGAPVVAKNVVIIGASHSASGRTKANVKGHIRGFDARTGKRLWIFHTIPQPGEVGNDTWLDDSWSYTGNTGVWTQMTVDEELGIVYLPVETPTGDYFGGHRHGNNLFAESLVALNLETGKRLWHYQFVHHGIWDFDIPCAPILADITVNGKKIKAIAQPTKQGFLFVFDRQTGAPVWPIEERPVEKGTVPTEWYSPTQPFPTKPPPYERQGFSADDVIDFTPEIKAEALKVQSQYKIGPLFTPPITRGYEGKVGTLYVPNGANWPGSSLEPETGMLYLYSHTPLRVLSMINDPQRSDMNYTSVGGGDDSGGGGLTVQGLPLVKPPWGRITGIDLNKGDIVWQVAHGETPDNVKNHPALKGLDIPRTGRTGGAGGSSGGIGTLVTKTLVISGEGGVFTTPTGQRGAMMRAYNKATGHEVGAVYMPGAQTGGPMTYMLNGKQYLVVAVSGAVLPGQLMAFTLPARR